MATKEIETIVALVSEKEDDLNRASLDVDWNRTFLLALWHKVAFIVYERLRTTGLLDTAIGSGRLPLLLANHWSQLVAVNQVRHANHSAELEQIDAALTAHGVRYAVGKGGPLLIPEIYSPYERKMYDVDLLADRSHSEAVIEALRGIGYQMGAYDRRTRTLRGIGKDDLRNWLLHSRGLPNFVKVADSRLIDHSICQVQFHLGDTKTGKTRPAGVLLDGRVRRNRFWAIERAAVLTQLGLHIYREFTDESFRHWGMGSNLVKFADLARWVDHLDDDEFAESVDVVRLLGHTAEISAAARLTGLILGSPRLEDLVSLDRTGMGRADRDRAVTRSGLYDAMDQIFRTAADGADESRWSKLVGFKTT
ncbi:nucleotidyltransferase family protein [Actinomadura chibensis]|uniref:Nucleotidyltransferase family protein n=1 Tax=Actinomadura chibensis TaxID=392828 RepID=A0A5D0NX05_9ACTN|nr:nucleotidyltransferase family protein [Actinomadura chibensis]TYB48531.1 nucleotidyltransferase family protein [Actinomadura chibensis]